MSVTLDAPNGAVSFADRGLEFTGLGAMLNMAQLYLRHLMSRRYTAPQTPGG